jgi:hypothetical protein
VIDTFPCRTWEAWVQQRNMGGSTYRHLPGTRKVLAREASSSEPHEVSSEGSAVGVLFSFLSTWLLGIPAETLLAAASLSVSNLVSAEEGSAQVARRHWRVRHRFRLLRLRAGSKGIACSLCRGLHSFGWEDPIVSLVGRHRRISEPRVPRRQGSARLRARNRSNLMSLRSKHYEGYGGRGECRDNKLEEGTICVRSPRSMQESGRRVAG